MKPEIKVKEGFKLNPNTTVVERIISLIEKNDGICICHNESRDPHCPCTDYMENDCCHCNLYLKCI